MANPVTQHFFPPISHRLGLIITGGISTFLLGSAIMFQYGIGLEPCDLCIQQRWPHLAIIILSLIGLRGFMPRVMIRLITIAGIVSVAFGSYHAGIEYGFWPGPAGCSANLTLDTNIKILTDQLLAIPLARCDEAVWSFLGLSMAGWNSLISLDIIVVALISNRCR